MFCFCFVCCLFQEAFLVLQYLDLLVDSGTLTPKISKKTSQKTRKNEAKCVTFHRSQAHEKNSVSMSKGFPSLSRRTGARTFHPGCPYPDQQLHQNQPLHRQQPRDGKVESTSIQSRRAPRNHSSAPSVVPSIYIPPWAGGAPPLPPRSSSGQINDRCSSHERPTGLRWVEKC